ncbi:MAG: FdtA/QdtA family cupin domain-containing protein, partial [Leeuwenhoekiella sp.]|nr:FdtA/QdtA family cupin domain-containing protein [Leeuwenhoekiella sp.]
MNIPRRIALPKIEDQRGNLSVIEQDSLPFKFKRVYYLYDVPSGASRGGHAHRK